MDAVAQEIAERVRASPLVRIVTHIDTDGITGGAIASEALDRASIAHEVAFVKKLDEPVVTELKRRGTPLVWFIDLGAGMMHALHGLDAVITDHHVPTEREIPKVLRSDLLRFAESQDRILMLNPNLEGAGSDVASGAGCAYALVAHMLERGCGSKEVERLVGETYTLIREPAGSPTRDAKEFGTLINACGRYDQPEVGYRVCRGDREDSLAEALRLLRGHREYLVDSMEAVAAAGINQMDAIQYFHAADTIRDTVVGIAASMALNRENATKDLPIFAFAQASDGIKVSARTTRELVARGLDLAEVMTVASGAVGGQGGGHHAAAGPTR